MDCYCDSRQNLILPQAAMSGFFVLDAEWFGDKGCYRNERAKPEEDYLLMQMVSFRFFLPLIWQENKSCSYVEWY
ncbi:hypothetical protein ACHA69_004123 [Klebsiella aerogenes]